MWIYVIHKEKDEKRAWRIPYCNKYIHVYDLANEDEVNNTSYMIKSKIDPTYDNCTVKWENIYKDNEQAVHSSEAYTKKKNNELKFILYLSY